MESFAELLYPLVSIISLSAFLPQIKTLLAATGPSRDIALSSWYLWTFASIVSLLYGVFKLQDMMFTVTTVLAVVMNVTIVGLVIYNRHFRFPVCAMLVEEPAPKTGC